MRSLRHSLFCLTFLAAATILVSPLDASLNVTADPSMSGGGTVHATDDFGGYFPDAATFTIFAGVNPGGSAYGRMNLTANGDFAAAWGACPYDPRCEPGSATSTLHLKGDVASVQTDGTTVAISGTLTEVDHGKQDGVIFTEEDVPFVITAEEGSSSFVLQFCAVPPFTMDVATGHISVHAGALSAGMLKRPSARVQSIPACR